MAPKSNKQILTYKAQTRALNRILRQSRVRGFNQTMSIMDSIYGNLSSNQKGLNRALTARQTEQLNRIADLQSRSGKRGAHISSTARDRVRLNYGSAISGGTDYTAVDAQANAAAKAMPRMAKGAVDIAKANSAAAQIAQSGAAEAKAGAQYATAEALKYRAQEDARLIAERQLALTQMKLESQLAWETYRKQKKLDMRMEQEANTPGIQGMSANAETIAAAATEMRNTLSDNPDATAAELAAQYLEDNPTADQNMIEAINQIATSVVRSVDDNGQTIKGYTRADEVDDILQVLSFRYQLNPKQQSKQQKTIEAYVDAYWKQQSADALEQEEARQRSGADNADALRMGNEGNTPEPPPDMRRPKKAARNGTTVGVTRSGRGYRYDPGGHAFYVDNGDPVPNSDLP